MCRLHYCEIFAKSVNIFGPFSVSLGRILSDQAIFFHPNSEIRFSEALFCLSEKADIHFNGKIHSSEGKLTAAGQNIFLAASARIESCRNISLLALNLIRSEPNSKIFNTSLIAAKAPIIFYEGEVESSNTIQMLAKKQGIFAQGSRLLSNNLIFLGDFLFLYGTLCGNVSFCGEIQQLHLAESSTIQASQGLQAKAILVEPYGYIKAETLAIESQSLWTKESSEFAAEVLLLKSDYAKLAGKYSAGIFSVDASELLQTGKSLSIESEKTAEIYAANIHLHGECSGKNHSIKFLAETILNEAWLQNFESVQMAARQILINSNVSAISGSNLDLGSKNVFQDGQLLARKIQIHSTEDLYLGEAARISSDQTVLISQNEGFIAGEMVSRETIAVQGEHCLRFQMAEPLKATNLQIKSPTISGKLSAKTQNSLIQASEEIRLLDGKLAAKENIFFQAPKIRSGAQLQSETIQFHQGEDNKKSSQIFLNDNGSVNASTLISQHDQIFLNSSVNVENIAFQASDKVVFSESTNIQKPKEIIVKTRRFKMSGKIETGENSKLFIDASQSVFTNGSIVILDTLQIKAQNIEFSASSVSLANKILIMGEGPSSLVILYPRSYIEAAQLFISTFGSLRVSGNLFAQEINLEVSHIRNSSSGIIGNSESRIAIQCETFIHRGIIEAAQASIKCHRYFLQLGWNAPASMLVRELNLLSGIYCNLLGTNKTHSASYLSFLSLHAGVEIGNFVTSNALISVQLSLRTIHPLNLWLMLKNIPTNKEKPFNLGALQTAMPIALTFVKKFNPILAMGLGLVLNSYFMFNSLRGLINTKLPRRALDILPILLGLKNLLLAGSSLFTNGIDLAKELKVKLPDLAYDIDKFIHQDLSDFMRDFPSSLKEVSEKLMDFYNAIKEIPSNIEESFYQFLKSDASPDKPEVPTNKPASSFNTMSWPKEIRDAADKLYNGKKPGKSPDSEDSQIPDAVSIEDKPKFQPEVFFQQWILPTLVLVFPQFSTDALISLRAFNPSFTGVENNRGLFFSASFCSPSFCVASNQQSLGLVYSNAEKFSYTSAFSGKTVYITSISKTRNLFIRAKDPHLASLRVATISLEVIELKPWDIQAANYHFSYQSAAHEESLLRLEGEWAVFKNSNLESVSFETYHALHFTKSFAADCSYSYKGTSIEIDKGVELSAKEKSMTLISSEGDIVNNGKLQAKEIVEDSADHILQKDGSSQSKSLYMHARNGISLDSQKISTKVGFLITDWGNIENLHGAVKATSFLYLDAKRGDVIGICKQTATQNNGEPDCIYTPAVFYGGDGKGFNGYGLVVHAGGKVVNDASLFGADEKFYIHAEGGLTELERHNMYLSYVRYHKRWLGAVKKVDKDYTLRLQAPTFSSKNASGVINVSHGRLDVSCGNFQSKSAIQIYSYEQPIFREIIVTSEHKSKTKLFSWRVAQLSEKTTAYLSSTFIAPEGIFIVVRHGDIILPDLTLDTNYLYTRTWGGKTVFIGHPVIHEIDEISWGFSCNLGPLHFSASFSPNEATRGGIDLSSFNQLENDGDKLNIANASIGMASKILNGNYFGLIENTGMGISFGKTHKKSYYETPSENYVRVGRWDDYSLEVSISGMSGAVAELRLHRAKYFFLHGQALSYHCIVQNNRFGLNYNPFINSAWATVGTDISTSRGCVHAVNSFNVGEVNFGRKITVDLKNAKFLAKKVQGDIAKLNLYSDYNDYGQNSFGASLGTNGTVAVNTHRLSVYEITEPAEFHMDERYRCQIHNIQSEGGKISGDGFKGFMPDSLKQTPAHSRKKESGFGFCLNLEGKRLDSVSFQNQRETHIESIQLNAHGLSMLEKRAKSGINFSLEIPYNVIGLGQQIFSSSVNLQPTPVSDQSPEDFIDFSYPFKKALNPESYAQYFELSEEEGSSYQNTFNAKEEDANNRIEIHYVYDGFINSEKYANYFAPREKKSVSQAQKKSLNIQFEYPFSLNWEDYAYFEICEGRFPGYSENSDYQLNFNVDQCLLYSENYAHYFDLPEISQNTSEKFLSRFNYPARDYLFAAGRGLKDAAVGVWNIASGVSVLWYDSALQSFYVFFPGYVPMDLYDSSSNRVNQRWNAVSNFAEGSGDFFANAAMFTMLSERGAFLSEDDPAFQLYLASRKNINGTIDAVFVPAINGVNWLIFDSTGPEIVEGGIAFYAPLKFISKTGELFNFMAPVSSESFLYRGSLTEPERVFKSGFNARGENLDLKAHADKPDYYFKDQKVSSDSAYVSTTTSKEVAARYAHPQPGEDGFLYEINPQYNAIDVFKTLVPEALQELDINPTVAFLISNEKPEFFEQFGVRAGLYITLKAENERVVPFKIPPREIKGAWKVDIEEIKFDDPRHPNFGFTDRSSYLRTPVEPFIPNPNYLSPIKAQKIELHYSRWVVGLSWSVASFYVMNRPSVNIAIAKLQIDQSSSFLSQEKILFLSSLLMSSGFFFGQALIKYLNPDPPKEVEFLYRGDRRNSIFFEGFSPAGNNRNIRDHVIFINYC